MHQYFYMQLQFITGFLAPNKGLTLTKLLSVVTFCLFVFIIFEFLCSNKQKDQNHCFIVR